MAILVPLLILIVMGIVQTGLWWHAQQAVDSAADLAADRAAAVDGGAGDGRAAATSFLAAAGNVTGASVTVERGDDIVTATVTGTAPTLLPGLTWDVSARAVAPTERFRPEVEEP